MMKTKFHILILVSFIVLGSCEQFIEVELPGQEPRMVLNALLEPTDTLKVFLTKSRGVLEGGNFFDEGFDLVEGANVYLKDQEGQIFPFGYISRGRPWEIEAFYYLANHNLVEGNSYEIFAEKEGFPTISSMQEIPKKVNIKSIEMINLGPDESYGGHNLFEVILKFEDPVGRNFFEISGEIFGIGYYINEGDTFPFYTYSPLNPKPVNPIYQKDFLMRNVLLFNDGLLYGPESEIVFKTNFPRDVDVEVRINFSHVSESYYMYYNSADLQQYNRGDFLSQPVLVYNNISNGMGIFKSRITDQRVIEMRVED